MLWMLACEIMASFFLRALLMLNPHPPDTIGARNILRDRTIFGIVCDCDFVAANQTHSQKRPSAVVRTSPHYLFIMKRTALGTTNCGRSCGKWFYFSDQQQYALLLKFTWKPEQTNRWIGNLAINLYDWVEWVTKCLTKLLVPTFAVFESCEGGRPTKRLSHSAARRLWRPDATVVITAARAVQWINDG